MRSPSPRRELATKADLEANSNKLAAWIEERFATKDELRAEVAKLATKDELRAEVAKLATKDELHAELAKLATKAELEKLATKVDDTARALMVGIESVRSEANDRSDRLHAEMKAEFARRPTHDDLARAVNTIIESITTQIRVIDETYSDVPDRVARLEAADLPARVARLEAARRRPR